MTEKCLGKENRLFISYVEPYKCVTVTKDTRSQYE